MDKATIDLRLARLKTALQMELPPRQFLIIIAEAQEAMSERQIATLTEMMETQARYGAQISEIRRMVEEMVANRPSKRRDD